MTKKKHNWLTRLDEMDQRAQARLDKDSSGGTRVRGKKRRSGKQVEEETTLKLAVSVYGFFVLEICTLAGVSLGSTTTQGSDATIASGLQLFIWLMMLAVGSVAIGIIALIKRPRMFYLHIPLILNSPVVVIVLIKILPGI